MEEKPRYSRMSDILDLTIYMLSKLNGVTLSDIQERFNVSRRTAERMRDSVINILPQVDELEYRGKQKRWGFVQYSLNELVAFNDNDLAILENLKNQNDIVIQKQIDIIIDKIKALNNRKLLDLEKDVELLLRTEGFAVRQTQDYNIDLEALSTIRQAIKEGLKIKATYKGNKKILNPFGLIFSEKIYLIALEELKGRYPYSYILHKLENIEVTRERFERKDFDIREYAKTSFGAFFGESLDVKLKFSKVIADDVLCYNFHPSQKMNVDENGDVIVKFKASGDKLIMWNLFRWGDKVEILSPKKLKSDYKLYMENILKNL